MTFENISLPPGRAEQKFISISKSLHSHFFVHYCRRRRSAGDAAARVPRPNDLCCDSLVTRSCSPFPLNPRGCVSAINHDVGKSLSIDISFNNLSLDGLSELFRDRVDEFRYNGQT
jgi:hypothetical protein